MADGVPDDFAALTKGAASVLAATRDADLRPRIVRAGAVTLAPDRRSLTVYVPEQAGAALLAVVQVGSPFAVTLSHVPTLRTLQLKGTVTGVRPARPDERGWIEEQAGGFTADLGALGFPLPVVRRLAIWPARAVEVRIESSFDQTPGPGAGQRLGSA